MAKDAAACVNEASAQGFPGRSCFDDYQDGFHDRLAASWPEKREQLHAGAERMTNEMVAVPSSMRALARDGEGPLTPASRSRAQEARVHSALG